MTNTRELILDKALELYSDYGYENVSMKELAAAVGIKAPSLYKHFPSKQDIFDALLESLSDFYEHRSVLSLFDSHAGQSEYERLASMSSEEIADVICEQVKVITDNLIISRTRKLLTIEQFRNSALCAVIEKRQYEDIYRYNRGLIEYFTDKGILLDDDHDIMTLQFIAPISIQLQRIDRLPSLYPEASDLIRRHIIQFFNVYRKGK